LRLRFWQVVFEAVRGENYNGYVALDELLVVKDPACTIRPVDATPTAPPTASPDHFPSCDFEADLCGWATEEEFWKWERYIHNILYIYL
jgi:hypothetical protein